MGFLEKFKRQDSDLTLEEQFKLGLTDGKSSKFKGIKLKGFKDRKGYTDLTLEEQFKLGLTDGKSSKFKGVKFKGFKDTKGYSDLTLEEEVRMGLTESKSSSKFSLANWFKCRQKNSDDEFFYDGELYQKPASKVSFLNLFKGKQVDDFDDFVYDERCTGAKKSTLDLDDDLFME